MGKPGNTQAPSANRQRTYVSQTDVPRHDLEKAVQVPKALEDHYGGGPASPIDVATSLKSTPGSSWFRMLTGAAIAYGLTDGGSNSVDIKLTPLGRRLVAPTSEGDDRVALREALLKPRIVREFLMKYDRKKLPPAEIAQNVLATLGVDKAAAVRTYEVILESARYAGVLRVMKGGGEWVDLRGAQRSAQPAISTDEQHDDDEGDDHQVIDDEGDGEPVDVEDRDDGAVVDGQESTKPKPIFVGHGKNKGPLGKVEDILKSFNIPYKTAISEASLGQPIPTKVKNVMRECGSAILIFTKDEKFLDAEGAEVWRPSENVVYELGAASLAYDDRVVIFMEEGLTFPANFESIGHIPFEANRVEAKAMDLIKELIGFKLLNVTPAG